MISLPTDPAVAILHGQGFDFASYSTQNFLKNLSQLQELDSTYPNGHGALAATVFPIFKNGRQEKFLVYQLHLPFLVHAFLTEAH